MTSSRLIGRAAELAELEAALRDAADGRPSLAFVAGESGVGKSRLVAELAGRAGARIAIGECVELGEEELPYAPIVSVLRTLARDDDPVLGELPDSVRAELATLLPELGGEARNGGGARTASRGCSRRCSRCSTSSAASSRSRSCSRTSTGPTARRAPSSSSSRAACGPSGCW